MRLTLFATLLLVASVVTFSFMQVNAAENNPKNNPVLGSGKNSCIDFIALVDHCHDNPDANYADAVSTLFDN